jgi:hypothetical protein
MERVNRCDRCKSLYKSAVESGICCVMAPDPTGWCCWCGKDLDDKKQVFCHVSCSLSYHQDINFGDSPKNREILRKDINYQFR